MLEARLEELQNEYESLKKENCKDESTINRLKSEMREIKECLKYKNKKEYMFKRLFIPFTICGGIISAMTPIYPLTIGLSAVIIASYIGCSVLYENQVAKFRDEHYTTYLNTSDELEHILRGKKREVKSLKNTLDNRNIKMEKIYNEIDSVGVKSELEKFYKEELDKNRRKEEIDRVKKDLKPKEIRKEKIEELYRLKEQYKENKDKIKER